MGFWKTAALSAALLGAAGVGAAMTPPTTAQTSTRVVTPRGFEVFGSGGSRIGVTVADLDTASKETGVRVDSVEDESPAAKAGLKKGDLVVEFDGERVRSVRQFTRLVSETPAGRQVPAAVMREGQRLPVNIEPVASSAFRLLEDETVWRALDDVRGAMRPAPAPPPPPAAPAAPRPPAAPRAPRPPAFEGFLWTMGNQLGVTVNGLSDQLREYFGAKNGVLVVSVTEDSAAAKAGVKAGDVIVSVNGTSIDDASDLREQMRGLGANQEFTLEIVRDKKAQTLKGKTEESRSRRMTTRTIV